MSPPLRKAIFFLVIIHVQQSIQATCPTGYSQQGSLCLKSLNSTSSPDADQCSAKQTCFNEAGRLPILHSATDGSDFDAFCTAQGVNRAWLGLTSSDYNTHPAFWSYSDGSNWVGWAPGQPGESGLEPTVFQQIGSGAYDTATHYVTPVCEADPTVSDTCNIAAVCSGLSSNKSSYLGSCYKFESTARSWDAAMDYCNNNAPPGTVGHLAWFYGACGYETIKNDMRAQGALGPLGSNREDIWVGMKEKDLQSTRGNLWWYSDTATPALPVGWGPDKMGGILKPDDSGQDCMRIWSWDTNNFQNSHCGNSMKFLCEFKCPENVISTYEPPDTCSLNCANMGGISHDERCYLLDTNGDPAKVKLPFDEGQAMCSSLASHGPNSTIGRVGQIRDDLAWETVKKLVGGTTGVFIGLIDKVGDDAISSHVWTSQQANTSDDVPLTFPSKMAVSLSGYPCVKIADDGAGGLHWTDARCDENNYILCELYCHIVTPGSTTESTATEQATTTTDQATTTEQATTTTEQATTTTEQATTTTDQATTTTQHKESTEPGSSDYNTHPAFWSYSDGSNWVGWAPGQPGESGLEPTVFQQIGSGAYDTATHYVTPVCEADPTVSDTCNIAAVCSGLGGITSSYLGSCYKFESTARSWDAAMDYCKDNAPSGTVGHLAWFYGACGYKTIRQGLRDKGAPTGLADEIWVGMKEKDLQSTRGNLWWYSDTATAALPVGWAPDKMMGGKLEPDDINGQDCMRIYHWEGDDFQDSNCSAAKNFLCEFKCPENVISTYQPPDTCSLNCANMGGVSHDERCYLLDTNGDPAKIKRPFDKGQAMCSSFASHGPNSTIGRVGQIRDDLAWETVKKLVGGTTGVFIGLIDKVGDDAISSHVWTSEETPTSDDVPLTFPSKMAVSLYSYRCVKIADDGAGGLHWTDARCDENNYILCELYCHIVPPVSTTEPTTTEQATTTTDQAATTEQATTTAEQTTTTTEQATTTTEQATTTTEQATTTTEQATAVCPLGMTLQGSYCVVTTTTTATTTADQATTTSEQATTTSEQAATTTDQAITASDQATTADQPTLSVVTAKPANQIYHVKQDSKYDQVSPTSPLMQFNTKGLLACSVYCAYEAECRYAQFEDGTGVCYLYGGINDRPPKLATDSGYRVGLYKPPGR